MNRQRFLFAWFSLVIASGVAAEDKLPGDREPLLRLRTEGPTAAVTAVAFGYTGKGTARQLALYAGGYDKVIRTWVREADGTFTASKIYRVPIGPGTQGTINSLAVSADGRWLAAAGISVVREAAGFFQTGFLMPRQGRMKDEMLQDEGTIYLFDTRANRVDLLRGHRGIVQALSFAPAREGKRSLLVSAAREETGKEGACVLRVWDAERGGDPLATSPHLPDPGNGRPGLAIWHSGRDPRQLRVAVACDRQPLRVWDAAAKDGVESIGKALFVNEPAAFAIEGEGAKTGTLFTCGTTRERLTSLYAWKVDGAADLQADEDRTVLLPKYSFSYSLALLPARPGDPMNRAALIQCIRKDKDPNHHEYYLLLLDLGRDKSATKLVANVRLWRGGERPALAAAPDGRHLAVAGGPDNRVCFFNVKDLAEKKASPKPIVSPGIRFQNVSFLRKKEARGLLLNEQTDRDHPWRGGLIFDFRQRLLTDQRDGWQVDAPELGDWKVGEPADDEKKAYGGVVWRRDRRIGAVVLAKNQPWTAWALLPPGKHKVPLLAIAYVERNVPYLGLWNALSGQQVRQFTGHLSPIRRVAFDAEGGRLVSVADDQTVRVWRLDDVEETLGKHGTLAGLALEQPKRGKNLRIAWLDRALLNVANRKALAQVKAGDVVAGEVVAGELRRLETPQAFYEAIWKRRTAAPWEKDVKAQRGEEVVLRIMGRDISLRIDQGVEDCKPLFSLFVTRERQWVGWSPQGPYDTVGGESHIGWHRNTGKPNVPTLFAEAVKYHKQFYRDGILHYLLERGSVASALEDWKKEGQGNRPHLDLWIAGLDARRLRERDRPAPARLKELTLQAEVSGIHPARVEKVEWRIFRNGEKEEPLGDWVRFAENEGILKVDLLKEKPNWQRGIYEARAAVTLREDRSKTLTESVWFHYPPPPVITFPKKWIEKTFGVEQVPERYVAPREEFHLEATIDRAPTVSATPYSVWNNGKKIAQGSGPDLVVDLKLEKGFNEVEIIAVNRGAADDSETREDETHRQRLVLYYDLDALPPQIRFRSVTPGDEVIPRREWIIGSPRVRIRGEIIAGKNLTAATYQRGAEKDRPLENFKGGQNRSFSFDEEIVLRKEDAGKRIELTFQANTEDGKSTQRIALVYKPALPTFHLDSRRIVAATEKEIDLRGHLEPPFDPYPYETIHLDETLVHGRRVQAVLDAKSGQMKIRTAVQPGRNPIRIRLSNGYRNTVAREEIYRQQPPRILLQSVGEVGPKSADFEAIVEMAAGQLLKKARLVRTKVGGQSVRDDEQDLTDKPWKSAVRGDVVTWTLTIKDVLLREGINTFELRAANEDGAGEPSAIRIEGKVPLPSPPTISFEQPLPVKIFQPRCELIVRVRSGVAPSDLEVKLNGRAIEWPRPPTPVKEGAGDYLYKFAVPALQAGTNLLEAKASNSGGSGNRITTNVSYIEPTMAFSLDGYKIGSKEGKLLASSVKAASSRVELHCALRWLADAKPSVKRPLPVRVWVNDFEQRCSPELLETAEKGWRFALPLCLNRETNRIKLRFPDGVILAEGDRSECVLQCAKPETGQRLHLLIIAPGKNGADLKGRLLKTLGARSIRGDRFETDAFTGGGRVHDVARPRDNPLEIMGLLRTLRDTLHEERSGEFNDVAIVYFQGEMRWDEKKNKRYLLTWSRDAKAPLRERGIDCDRIRDLLGGVLGAKLLLLDLASEKGTAHSIADDSGLIGDFQYVWLGGANDRLRHQLMRSLEQTLGKNQPWNWRKVRQELEQVRGKVADLEVTGRTPKGYDEIPLKGTK